MEIIFSLILTLAQAQTANIKDVPMNDTTTISIKKGEAAKEKTYEIVEGEDEVSGDPELVIKEARASWKKACDEWKKEIKDLNKTNQLIHINCGKMACTKEGTDHSCKSQGKYKVKTKMVD